MYGDRQDTGMTPCKYRSQHQNIIHHAHFVVRQVIINGDGGCRLWQSTGGLTASGYAVRFQ